MMTYVRSRLQQIRPPAADENLPAAAAHHNGQLWVACAAVRLLLPLLLLHMEALLNSQL
jgi:hypothetical protein